MELQQIQTHQLGQWQMQSVMLLQMSALELKEYLQEISLENPVIDLNEQPEEALPQADDLIRRLAWLQENDRQNLYYNSVLGDELDPLARAGTAGGLEESLFRTVDLQLDGLKIKGRRRKAVLYLAASLDEDGYLRETDEALAAHAGTVSEEIAAARKVLRSLEPAGIGAEDLKDCLLLQLERIPGTELARRIVEEHLDQLANHSYRSMARALHCTEDEVCAAAGQIRGLDPAPGRVRQSAAATQYVQPDLQVFSEDGEWKVRLCRDGGEPFFINSYYLDLYKTTEDKDVRLYLQHKLQQANSLLQYVGLRKSTLLRCGECILERQKAFFEHGAAALQPLRMEDAAEELGVSVSTVSRAIRQKYLQCPVGLFPLSYFFSGSVGDLSGAAARALLKRLIEEEDKASPLSDQQLCERMAQEGCSISRRTAAKYRSEMRIPGAGARRG